MKLTPNFNESEVLDWWKFQNLSQADANLLKSSIALAYSPEHRANALKIAMELEKIRASINQQFPQYKGKIGIRALSWFRPRSWEVYRKRSGNSQHIHGHAVDWIIIGVSGADYPIIMEWVWQQLQQWNGGLARLYKNKRWSFIHIDLGLKRTWEY